MLMIALIVVGGFAFYVMNADERLRALRGLAVLLRVLGRAGLLAGAVVRWYSVALLGRKRWALAGLGAVAVLLLSAGIHARYLRSLTDIRPEIERVRAIEEKTVRAYDAAVAQFRLGALPAEALARMIKRSVMPELQAVRLHLKSLERVPTGHQTALTRADEYLHLRNESWRLRADALERRSMSALRKAERAERVSLDAFARVRLDELP